MAKGNLIIDSASDDSLNDRWTDDDQGRPLNGSPDKEQPTRDTLKRQLTQAALAAPTEMCDIPDDIYSMYFLSSYFGPGFWYALYVTALKMALYTFLMIDAIESPMPQNVDHKLLATQFLMLPVSVAIQEDLTHFFFTVANVHWSKEILEVFPDATCFKFFTASFFRGIDGFFSLLVNFVILLKADTVLTLFLNFAALQFLQTIDNIAFHLCIDGYLFETMETLANQVTEVKLPRKVHSVLNVFDSALFLLSYIGILLAWIVIQFK
eukprot:scaffold2558_cov172-Amphora_coffeaeformis.AAC.17